MRALLTPVALMSLLSAAPALADVPPPSGGCTVAPGDPSMLAVAVAVGLGVWLARKGLRRG